MSSAAQVLRQAESLKATISESGKSVSDLWVTRQRLEDLYKRLLLMDLEYALDKKVEQDLWNHAFKNQITALQAQAKEKSNPKKAEAQANLNLFLETASGFYLQFLQLICSTFRLDLPFRRKSAAFGVMKEKCQLRSKITPPKKSSCLYICQYCLVHLGDIARYRQQVEQAQTYYRHAVNLSPQNGQPYNQLAILEVNRNNKLSSVFYYVRSLAVRHPFPVAATNLEKFYSKLIKDTSEFKGKMAQNEFVNAFLQFQALLHLSADFNRASYLCSRILACLPAHLMSQTFSASVLVQCIAITIFTLNHVRHVPSGGESGAGMGKMDEGGGDGGERKKKTEEPVRVKAEVFLSSDEQRSVDIILGFTASVLELLVQHTPRLPVKARESPTLPAIQVLLDWLRHSPDIIANPPFSTLSIWGHLAKILNVIQQFAGDKPRPDLTKYEEVPLPEDTELRCFQPIEKAHSKYVFSRIPVDGFPRGVEELVRSVRLVNQGKSIAEEFPELKLTVSQQIDPPCINFSAPEPRKGGDALTASPQDRRSKQNVAMQAIMKHGQNEPADMVKGSDKEGALLAPKYLLGTVTSEPQFMKHGGGGGGPRLQPSPQPSPTALARRGQSPQGEGSSPLPGFSSSPRGTSPMPGQARVASPLPPAQSLQQQPPVQVQQQMPPQQQSSAQTSPPLAQQKHQPQIMKQAAPPKQQFPQQLQQQQHLQQQQQHQQQNLQQAQQQQFGGQAHVRGPHPMAGPFPITTPPSVPTSTTDRGVGSQHIFHSGTPYQGQGYTAQGQVAQGQGHAAPAPSSMPQGQMHPQGHPYQSQGHGTPVGQGHGMPASQGHPGQGMPLNQGHGIPVGQGHGVPVGQGHRAEGPPPAQTGSTQEGGSSFPPFQMAFPGMGGDRFRMPVPGMGARGAADTSPGPRVPLPAAGVRQGTSVSTSGNVPQGVGNMHGVRPGPPSHALNQEMLSALRLASQISHHQQQQLQQQHLGMGAHLSPPQQQQQNQRQLHVEQQVQRGITGQLSNRPPMSHGPTTSMSHGITAGPSPMGRPGMGQFPTGLPPQYPHPAAGMGFPPGAADLMKNLAATSHPQHLQPSSHHNMPPPTHPSSSYPQNMPSSSHPHPHLQLDMGVGVRGRGQEMGGGEGQSYRPPPPPIPLPGHPSLGTSAGFPPLSHQLLKEDGSGQRAETGRGFQALSPLTIQPPKPAPPDNRISTSFQGHAEGTPKPDKTETFVLEKREGEPVIRRVEMPVAQPSGEYSLFASSSPWPMPLNSGNESKSLASSPFSSQEGSMRNSPIIGFDTPVSATFDSSARYRGQQADSWVGQGHEEVKGRGQHPTNMQSMWAEAPTMTPLERLLEQQRLQRQTDPH